MASSALTVSRCFIRTLARTIAPFSSTPTQVVLGNYYVGTSSNLFDNIVSTGPWLFIHPASGTAKGQTFDAEFSIKCDLLSGFPADASFEFTTTDDITANLIKAFTGYEQWVRGRSWEPFGITFDEPKVISKTKPIITSQIITCTFRYIADQAYAAVMLNDDNDVVFDDSTPPHLVFVD